MHVPQRSVTILAAVLIVVSACGSPAPAPGKSGAASTTASPGSACTVATAPSPEDWNQRVWYEVFVRSFADGNGDGIGDLRGLTAKLDYLNDGNPATTTDLGVTGIWLMPVFDSPSYHGYDVIDYRKIEKDYGTNADFAAFLAAAHKRGIKVILDLVLNHTSNQNPWFLASAKKDPTYADWYVWSDTNPSYMGPENQVVWRENGGRWYYGLFSEQMPDLNLKNPAVTAEMESIARYWLNDVGVDGFRLDAAKYLIEEGKNQANTKSTVDWLTGFHKAVLADKADAMLVGEVWDTSTTAGSYVPGAMDLTFNFGLSTGTRLALQNQRVAPLKTGLMDTLTAWPSSQSGIFLANHDQNRIMGELGGDTAAAKLAAFLLFSEPGVPFMYYGEEIGMTGHKPDEQIRTPMQWTGEAPAGGFSTVTPWEPMEADWQSVNVAAQTGDATSLLSTYRSLIQLRANQPALAYGATAIVDGGAEPVIGILRTLPGRSLLTVTNVSGAAVADYALALDGGPLCGAVKATVVASTGVDAATLAALAGPSVSAAGGFEAYKPFAALPPRSAVVIELEPLP
jgi:glycosidase